MSKKGDYVSSGYWNVCTNTDENTGEKTFETYSLWSKASDRETNDGSNIQALKDGLEVNNGSFVFDYQDGLYGYNTDINKGVDTFCSFGINQIKINLKSYMTRNRTTDGADLSQPSDYITFPISIIDSVKVDMISFTPSVEYADGNENYYYHIYVQQTKSDGYNTASKQIKYIDYFSATTTRHMTVTSDEFLDVTEYPYLRIEGELYTDYSGQFSGDCVVTINLK